jgi:hypothetical protein
MIARPLHAHRYRSLLRAVTDSRSTGRRSQMIATVFSPA